MKVLEHLAYGRGILLVVVITGLLIYWLLKKKEVNNFNDLKKYFYKNIFIKNNYKINDFCPHFCYVFFPNKI